MPSSFDRFPPQNQLSDTSSQAKNDTFTVSQLNRKVKALLETHLRLIWVEGEISNLSRPSSGHWYFTLKDDQAQIKCAMFRGRNSLLKFNPKAGDKIKVRGRVSLYEGRGDYQLIVEHMEEAGFGLLQKRFEELKAKLFEQGLFDEGFKKPLPTLPSHIAIVTSPTGAAVRDVLSVLERRFSSVPATIIPCPVQGEDAPEKIIEALSIANRTAKFDVIIMCRGGGSIEDLWAFNSEKLAKAIFASDTPIVSAVGHEVDFTIADFVADARAATPSAAAELVTPEAQEITNRLGYIANRNIAAIRQIIQKHTQTLKYNASRLKHPKDKIQHWSQRLDNLELRFLSLFRHQQEVRRNKYEALEEKLKQQSPEFGIQQHRSTIDNLEQRLARGLNYLLNRKKQRFSASASALDIVSPLSTLRRGYAIASTETTPIVRSIKQIEKQTEVRVKLHDGTFVAEVSEISETVKTGESE